MYSSQLPPGREEAPPDRDQVPKAKCFHEALMYVLMGSSRPFYDNLLHVGCELLTLPLKVNCFLKEQESIHFPSRP